MFSGIQNIDELIKIAEPQTYRQPSLPISDDGWSNDDNPQEPDPGLYENSEDVEKEQENGEEYTKAPKREVYTNIKNINNLLMKFGDESMKPTLEMKEFFDARTKKHIDLVKKYCKKIHDLYGEEFSGIIERGESHDESKWHEPELIPYIYITWDYKCKREKVDFEIPEEIKAKMNDASEHHVNSNAHHPEYHSSAKGKINREDRDAVPDEIIDAIAMNRLDIAELVCDWCAMSEEKGNSPVDWADKNINTRWKFSDETKYLIYELINDIWS